MSIWLTPPFMKSWITRFYLGAMMQSAIELRPGFGRSALKNWCSRPSPSRSGPAWTRCCHSSNSRGEILAESRAEGARDPVLGYRFAEAGVYSIAVRDFQNAGGADVYYRLNAGALPYATSVFPLGFRATHGEVALRGFNLNGELKLPAAGQASGWGATVTLRDTPNGPLVEPVRLAVGEDPEVTEEDQPHNRPASAQRVTVPVTINGRIAGPGPAELDCYRFHAAKGAQLVMEVEAAPLGSPLEFVIEVVDVTGRPVERATLRCVAQTDLTLSDRNSATPGLRLLSWKDLTVNDFVYVAGELIRVRALPKGPDDDVQFWAVRGQRAGFLDTTPVAHAQNTTAYKVQIHPPGRVFPPNGMPVFHLYYRNDDGGPLYGKDSRLFFTAPADGDYVVRIGDVRGDGSDATLTGSPCGRPGPTSGCRLPRSIPRCRPGPASHSTSRRTAWTASTARSRSLWRGCRRGSRRHPPRWKRGRPRPHCS